jgi:hypothetical protein
MNARKRTGIICVLLSISIGNYSRIEGTENIRTIEFIAILVIGALSGLLLREIAEMIKNKWLV